MYIQGRTVQKWSNLIKSHKNGGRDEVHLLAGLRFSRLYSINTAAPRKTCQQTNALRQHHNLNWWQAL